MYPQKNYVSLSFSVPCNASVANMTGKQDLVPYQLAPYDFIDKTHGTRACAPSGRFHNSAFGPKEYWPML